MPHVACAERGAWRRDCRLPRVYGGTQCSLSSARGLTTGLKTHPEERDQKRTGNRAFPKGRSPKHQLYQKVRKSNEEDTVMGKRVGVNEE